MATILVFIGTYGLLTALLLRLLNCIAPFRIGAYSMADRQFMLWKMHAVIGALGRSCLSLFFPIFFRPVYYSFFGASIGRHIAIGGKILDPLLTRIEDYAILGEDSIIAAHVMTHDRFFLGEITVKKKVTVGVGVIIMPGVEVGENSIILPGSVVTIGTQIPPNEIWGGSPARKIKDVEMLNFHELQKSHL